MIAPAYDYQPTRSGRLTKKGRPFRGWAKPFDAFVMPEPNTGCWLWMGACNSFGHGHYHTYVDGKKRNMNAHRYSWTIHRGPIPEGMCVCHSCDVPQCVNPDHLFLGTDKDNMVDRDRKGRNPFIPGAKTCQRGHPWTPENTIIDNHRRIGKQRKCRACEGVRRARYKLERERRRLSAGRGAPGYYCDVDDHEPACIRKPGHSGDHKRIAPHPFGGQLGPAAIGPRREDPLLAGELVRYLETRCGVRWDKAVRDVAGIMAQTVEETEGWWAFETCSADDPSDSELIAAKRAECEQLRRAEGETPEAPEVEVAGSPDATGGGNG